MRILVIEDDKTTAGLLKHCLEEYNGHLVRVASSVREALRELECHYPELIVMDYWLGDGHGDKILPYIKEGTPTILVTAAPQPEEIQRICKIGYLVKKPFDYEQLINTVETVLKQR